MLKKVQESILAKREAVFVPVPEEQRLTEEGMIELERQIIHASIKNEMVMNESIRMAEESADCI